MKKFKVNISYYETYKIVSYFYPSPPLLPTIITIINNYNKIIKYKKTEKETEIV